MSSTHNSAAEAKSENIRVMGGDLGPLYDALWQEVASVHHTWDEYVQLFGTKQSRIELLNQAAPAFFRTVQDAMWNDVLLHVARLIDSTSTAGKANLSLRRLPDVIANEKCKVAVRELLAKAQVATEFCRDWRNRRLAHRDLRLSLDQETEPLQFASRAKVDEALASLVAVLNAVSMHYKESTTFFDIGGQPGGAVQLLYILDDGIKANEKRRALLRSGTFRAEDHGPKDL